MEQELTQILAPYKGKKGALVPLLQKVQEELGYLSEEAVSEITKFLR
ncbi:MAG: NADH-quinone oxidoreductase subunit E, partial [Armatimonadetes bacterium CG07_land_8_20_14_0_80_40_9]